MKELTKNAIGTLISVPIVAAIDLGCSKVLEKHWDFRKHSKLASLICIGATDKKMLSDRRKASIACSIFSAICCIIAAIAFEKEDTNYERWNYHQIRRNG